jgi:precorrin-4 methylase
MNKGIFFIIGAGPGGPRQTTLEALECMKRADVVLCPPGTLEQFAEYLQGKKVLGDPWAGLFDYKGKQWQQLAQSDPELIEEFKVERIRIREEIVAQVKQEMAQGRNVALIENGDPCLFGPSHWFIEGFDADEVEVIPGVGTFSVAMAALKKSSIPSFDTRFVMQTSPLFLYGNRSDADILKALEPYPGTMVFYMALWNLEGLVARLRENCPADLPIAIVYYIGCAGKQRIVEGTLADILEKVRDINENFAGLVIAGKCIGGKGYRPAVENLVRV